MLITREIDYALRTLRALHQGGQLSRIQTVLDEELRRTPLSAMF